MIDPATRFYLSNGASLERINWLGDTPSKGMREFTGVIVNYLYGQSQIDAYHEAYVLERQINISNQLKELLKKE